MLGIKQVAAIVVLVIIVSCSPRSYVVAPSAGRASVLSGTRDYSQTPKALDASSSAPAKVPSPEDKLEKREQAKKQSSSTASSVDFAAAIEEGQGTQTNVIIDPDNAPVEENLAPLSNSFIGNETEHIKFARYDPFGAAGYFILELDKTDYCYPIAGKYSSGYGSRGRSMHSGVDLVAPAGTPIYAIFDGTVRLSKPYSGYGNVIVVRHENGLETVYAHNSRNMVRVGQKVARGEQIAVCGRTGRATTNHLHFEVRVQGATINPLLLIDAQNRKLQSGVLRVTRSSSGAIAAKRAAGKDELVLADNTPKAETKTVESTTITSNTTTTSSSSTAAKTAAVAAAGATASDDIIMPKEAAKPNASRGMRVGDKVYEAPKTATATNPSIGNATHHKVAYGQTMSAIARKYGTSVSAICKLNNIPLDRADKIKEGQNLRVK